MTNSETLVAKIGSLADAVRSKTGDADPLTIDQMAAAVSGLEVGGGFRKATGTYDPESGLITFPGVTSVPTIMRVTKPSK